MEFRREPPSRGPSPALGPSSAPPQQLHGGLGPSSSLGPSAHPFSSSSITNGSLRDAVFDSHNHQQSQHPSYHSRMPPPMSSSLPPSQALHMQIPASQSHHMASQLPPPSQHQHHYPQPLPPQGRFMEMNGAGGMEPSSSSSHASHTAQPSGPSVADVSRDLERKYRESITHLRRSFEDRLTSLTDELSTLFSALQKDEVVNQMANDGASAAHIQDHIREVISASITNEQQSTIERLVRELAQKESESIQLSREVESLRTGLRQSQATSMDHSQREALLQEEITRLHDTIAQLQGNVNVHEKLRTEIEDAKQKVRAESHNLQDKISKLNDQNLQLQAQLEDKTKLLLQREIELRDLLQTHESEQHLIHSLKSDFQKLDRDANQLKKRKKELKVDNDQLRSLLDKSERERLDLRSMYTSLHEKVDSILKNELSSVAKEKDMPSSLMQQQQQQPSAATFPSSSSSTVISSHHQQVSASTASMSAMSNAHETIIIRLQTRVKELKTRLMDEMKEHKVTQKNCKKTVKELEQQIVERDADVKQMKELVDKAQSKLEKYRDRVEEERKINPLFHAASVAASLQQQQPNQSQSMMVPASQLTEAQRRIRDLEDDLRDAQRSLAHTSEETERRLRETYEGRVHALQREIAEKDSMINHKSMKDMIEAQLHAVKESLAHKEDQKKENYELKLSEYQRDYIPKQEHALIVEQRLNESEARHHAELQEQKAKFELDTRNRLSDLDERKSRELANALTNVRSAVKSLETDLEDEKKQRRGCEQSLEEEVKLNSALRIRVEEEDKAKRVLISHLEEATRNIARLKSMLEEEMSKRREAESTAEQVRTTCSKLKEEMEEEKTARRIAETQLHSTREELNRLEITCSKEHDRLTLLQQDLQKKTQSLETAEMEIDNLNAAVKRTSENALEEQRRRSLEEQERMETMQQMTQQAQTECAVARADRQRSNERVNEMQEMLEDAREQIRLLKEECNKMEQRFSAQIREERQNSEREQSSLTKQLDARTLEVSNMHRVLERIKWTRAQKSQKFELLMRQNLSSVKTDVLTLRGSVEKDLLTARHMMEKVFDVINKRYRDQIVALDSSREEEKKRLNAAFDEQFRSIKADMEQRCLERESALNSQHSALSRSMQSQIEQSSKTNDLLELQKRELRDALAAAQQRVAETEEQVKQLDSIRLTLDAKLESVTDAYHQLQDNYKQMSEEKSRIAVDMSLDKKKSEDSAAKLERLLDIRVQRTHSILSILASNMPIPTDLQDILAEKTSLSSLNSPNNSAAAGGGDSSTTTFGIALSRFQDLVRKHVSDREASERELDVMRIKEANKQSDVIAQELRRELDQVRAQLDATTAMLDQTRRKSVEEVERVREDGTAFTEMARLEAVAPFKAELKSMQSRVDALQRQYEQDVAAREQELRAVTSKCEEKLRKLEAKNHDLQRDLARMGELKQEKSSTQDELNKTKHALERCQRDLDKKRGELDDVLKGQSKRAEDDAALIREFRKRIEEKEKAVHEEEKKRQLLQDKLVAKDKEISELHTLLERSFSKVTMENLKSASRIVDDEAGRSLSSSSSLKTPSSSSFKPNSSSSIHNNNDAASLASSFLARKLSSSMAAAATTPSSSASPAVMTSPQRRSSAQGRSDSPSSSSLRR